MKETLAAPPKLQELIKVRAVRDTDVNFILNSWLKTYKYSGQSVRRVPDSIYFAHYEPLLKKIIKRSDVYVAALREDEDVIVGYLVIERKAELDFLHWLLVKDLWQRMGVGSLLLRAAEPKVKTRFTHWTNPIDSLANKFPFAYDPFSTI